MAGISLKDIREFFGMSLSEFGPNWWETLGPEGREQIKTGIENGSLTY